MWSYVVLSIKLVLNPLLSSCQCNVFVDSNSCWHYSMICIDTMFEHSIQIEHYIIVICFGVICLYVLIFPCISACQWVKQPAEECESGESDERGECDIGYIGRFCRAGDII